MIKTLLKPFSSFRTQLVVFILAMLAVTALVITFINQRLERRTTLQVDEYIRTITVATDIVYRSFSEGKYIFNLVNQPGEKSLIIDDNSVIQHILVVEADGRIYDSSDRKDVDRQFNALFKDIPAVQIGDLKSDIHETSTEQSRTLSFSIETERAKRTIFIIISMSRLKRVKDIAERDRLIAFTGLGTLLLITLAIFSKNFTQPITELGRAARKVTEGELDFEVRVSGPEEVSRLTKTFNEMLSGLRNTRELEDQLQRAERSAMVGRLASGIAHEIRNPLNFINLSIDHLREKFAPKTESELSEYSKILTTIKDELARLNRLVSDFLSYGRPAKLKIREVDSRSLIEEVRSLVNAKSEQQNIRIRVEENGGGDSKIHADAEQLKTCFSNLMINAVQAMPDGGALNISLRPDTTQIEIDFSDTGVGIDSEVIEQVFEPYYSTKETGIGLGLPLTKKIIEEHGGSITVTSEPGKGTTFTVMLMRNPEIID